MIIEYQGKTLAYGFNGWYWSDDRAYRFRDLQDIEECVGKLLDTCAGYTIRTL